LLVTTAHGVSGSNNTYWPEIYTNMPIVDEAKNKIYRDTPQPRRFGAVSAFDPQLFSSVDDCRDKYAPAEVAEWLEGFAQAAARHWQEVDSRASSRTSAEFRRWAADVAIQSGLGLFYAWKFRAAVLWAVYEQTSDQATLREAIKAYRTARNAWAELAARAKGVYVSDITYGMTPHLRGHWAGRLAAIDEDLADMEKRLAQANADGAGTAAAAAARAMREIPSPPARPAVPCRHTPPARMRPGEPLLIELAAEAAHALTVRVHYRHANQAENWQIKDAERRENRYRALISPDYTQSPYPLLYYFEVQAPTGTFLYPGLQPDLSNQPYFVVRKT